VAAVTSSLLADALRDRYVLERELGRGGMAVVYLALDLKHKRPVALKVLHPELARALGPERLLSWDPLRGNPRFERLLNGS
jgi:serine/threonine protein kinase